jgi:ornithine carbamoyltransferase
VKKNILSIIDMEKKDLDRLFERAKELKQRKKEGILDRPLAGKTLGLIFEKASTRTRVSFEAAMQQLGGSSMFISSQDTHMVRKEPIKDTARVLSRYLDAVAIRTYSQEMLEEFSRYADIPVINALTDMYHPCQVLSDIQTVIECKGGYENRKIAWVGDGNNVAQSWISAASVLGLNLYMACPEGYFPDERILEDARETGKGKIQIGTDPEAAVKDADVINTDVWASMGKEEEAEKRKNAFLPYQVNAKLVSKAKPDVIVMHCLPAHRDEEITEEVMEGERSVVWDQSENKMHMQKAVLEALLG